MTRKNEAGQALVFAVVALGLLLLGFVGLGIDIGYLRYEKRLQQSAADSAAISGAAELRYDPTGVSSISAAQNAAAVNGFIDNSGGVLSTCTSDNVQSSALVGTVCVQVNNPPASGPHTGDPNYVEAFVSAVQPTFFMSVLGVFSEAVTARAVATSLGGGAGSGCLYILGPPPSSIEGGGTLSAPTCGIIDDGNFNLQGNALVVNAGTFGIAGTNGGGTITCTSTLTCPALNMPTSGDPLSGLLTPPIVGPPGAFNPANPIPGTYNLIALTDGSTTNFNPGVYVLTGPGGGLSITGNAIVTGTGVTFYFTNGATISVAGDVSGTPTIQLSAPNSAPYTGILFYQDPSDIVGPTLGGNSASFYQGALYFPSALLTINGSINTVTLPPYTILIANSLALVGAPVVALNSNYSGLPNGVSIIQNAGLVE